MNSADIPGVVEYVDKFLPLTLEREIIKVVSNMPWFWRPTIAQFPDELYADSLNPFEDPRVTDAFAFAHVCYSDNKVQSDYYEYFKSILRFLELKKNIEITEILRIRLRLTPQFPGHAEGMFNPPHVDMMTTDPFKTFVYYVWDSDGDTTVFNKKYNSLMEPTVLTKNQPDLAPIFTSTPKQGEGVYFDGLQYHSGNSPINHKSRCIINFDFKIRE